MSNFHDLGLSRKVRRAVDSEGYECPTSIQLRAIPEVVAGRDLMGIAQTGRFEVKESSHAKPRKE